MTAPLITATLPVVIKGLAETLKTLSHPAAKGAGAALDVLENTLREGAIKPEDLKEINRHIEKLEELNSTERTTAIAQVNESLRAEVASQDAYVRRMRPTFGYLIALTWAAQMFAIAYVIVADTGAAGLVIQSMESLGTIWGVGLSVLGIYVYKRSDEKRGGSKPPLVQQAAEKIEAVKQKVNAKPWYNE